MKTTDRPRTRRRARGTSARNRSGGSWASSSASGIVSTLVRAGISTLRDQAGLEAQQVTQLIREQGDRYLQERKSRAADELSHVGEAVRLTADKLRDENIEMLAGYVDSAAQSIDSAAEFLEKNDLADLGRDLERLARRQPGLVLAGLFVAGLALGRFVKSGLSTDTE